MATTKELIGREDLSFGQGTFARGTSNGGTTNITKLSSGVEVFNVKDYGAVGDGTTDDTTAIQAAIDAAEITSGVVYIPATTNSYRAINLNITEPIGLMGDGYGSHIRSNGDGTVFFIDEGSTQNPEGQNPGVTIRDLKVSGNARLDNACAFKLAHLDHARFDNLWIEEFLGTNEANNNGACFTFWDSVRECYFSNIKMRYGGTYNTKHMLFIADAGSDTQDSSNTCTFSECQFVYYYGDAVVITDSAASSNRIRGMRFIDCLWHGVLMTLPIHVPTTNDETSRSMVITNSEANIVQNCLFSTTPRDNPCITINDDSTGAPANPRVNCIVRGNRFTNHIGGSPGTKHAIKLDAGTCEIRGNTFVAQDPAWETVSGSTIYRDDSNVFIGAPTSGKIIEVAGTGPQVFSGDGIEQDLGGTYTVQTHNAAGNLTRRFSAAGNTDTKELKLQGVSLQVGSAIPTHTTDAGGAALADVALYIRSPSTSDDSALYLTTDGGTIWSPVSTTRTIVTLDNTGTPSVLAGTVFKTGGTTTITDFDDGIEGKTITIISEHAITITDGTNIFLNGSVNFVMAASDTLTLVQKADTFWYEISRSVN